VIELVASYRPVRDTETLLMPFVDSPPAERWERAAVADLTNRGDGR
jgi:hypothetical protein